MFIWPRFFGLSQRFPASVAQFIPLAKMQEFSCLPLPAGAFFVGKAGVKVLPSC